MSKPFAIKYKFDQLYLGEIDNEPVLTTLDNKNAKKFLNKKKALRFYRGACSRKGYTSKLFDIVQINNQ